MDKGPRGQGTKGPRDSGARIHYLLTPPRVCNEENNYQALEPCFLGALLP